MNTREKRLSHLESLEIIAEAIGRTKTNYRENSFYFLLWGWLVSIASFSFFILHHYTSTAFYFIPFPVSGAIGITATTVHYVRQRAVTPVESYLGYYLSRLWLVLGLCFIAVVFINVLQHHTPFTYTLLVAGIGTLVSGMVMQFRPMVWGGAMFLLAAVLSIFVPEDYRALLHGIAIAAGHLIPGYLLKYSGK